MAGWAKLFISAVQQVLLAFSSYEYGKNTELELHQNLEIANKFEKAHFADISEKNDSSKSIWIVIGLIAFATTLYIVSELKSFLSCKRSNSSGNRVLQNQIELQSIQVQPRAAVRNIPIPQANQNAPENIDVNA